MQLRAAGPEALEAEPAGGVAALVPFVHVSDVDVSASFYALLGFEAGASHRHGDELQWVSLSNGSANIMLALADAPVIAAEQAVLFYLYSPDLYALRDQLVAHGILVGEIGDGSPGPRQEMRLTDPDGYCLTVAQIDVAGRRRREVRRTSRGDRLLEPAVQGGGGGAVRADVDDREPAAGVSAAASSDRGRRAQVPQPDGGRVGREVDPVRGAEDAFEARRRRPAAASRRSRRRRCRRRRSSGRGAARPARGRARCGRRGTRGRRAGRTPGRRRPGARAPRRVAVETTPSMPLTPRLPSDAQAARAGRHSSRSRTARLAPVSSSEPASARRPSSRATPGSV